MRKTQKPNYGPGVFVVNTSYCRSELETLQHVIYTNNFKETSVGGDLYWFALALNQKDFKKDLQKVFQNFLHENFGVSTFLGQKRARNRYLSSKK